MTPADSVAGGGNGPRGLVAIAGTSTAVGKTYVTAALARALRAGGVAVRARKPLQSSVPGETSDAVVLADATGEDPLVVCPPRHTYPLAMAPPMAADALGWAVPTLGDVLESLADVRATRAEGWVTLVETVGGVRSPCCADADSARLVAALEPDCTVLVAPSGLGVINAVRLALGALGGSSVIVYVNHFDPLDAVHRRSVEWLAAELGGAGPTTSPDALAQVLSGVLSGS